MLSKRVTRLCTGCPMARQNKSQTKSSISCVSEFYEPVRCRRLALFPLSLTKTSLLTLSSFFSFPLVQLFGVFEATAAHQQTELPSTCLCIKELMVTHHHHNIGQLAVKKPGIVSKTWLRKQYFELVMNSLCIALS